MKNIRKNSYILLFFLAASFLLSGCCKSEKLFNKTWVLEKYGKESALEEVSFSSSPGQKQISLTFDKEINKFGGNDGCNHYFGKFTLKCTCKIELDSIMKTLMMCYPNTVMQQAGKYSAILDDVKKYKVSDNELTLSTKDDRILIYKIK